MWLYLIVHKTEAVVLKQNNVIYSDLMLGSVTQTEIADGFPGLIIEHINCNAKVSFYGGQVLSWHPSEQKEVFWLSDEAVYQQGKAIRGGIPLCWPWFGPLEGTTQHGFARQIQWRFDLLEVSDDGVSVVLSWQGGSMDTQWPYDAKIEQRLFFGKTFKQTLSITNMSDVCFEHTSALHSYFNVSSPKFVSIPKLNKSAFDDKLTGQRIDALVRDDCVGPIDTVYFTNQPQQLIDHQWERVIQVTNQHTEQWVLWNPGEKTAKNMTDVHFGGENQFVCLEAANTRNQIVQPNQTVIIGQEIEIQSTKDEPLVI